MKKITLKKIVSFALCLTFLTVLALPVVVAAQENCGADDPFCVNANYTNLNGTLGDKNLKEGISSIIQVLLGFLGIIAVIIILWGGFIWMTAMGDEGKVEKAKKLIIAGVIGIVIILAAYSIASFVIGQIGNATRGS